MDIEYIKNSDYFIPNRPLARKINDKILPAAAYK